MAMEHFSKQMLGFSFLLLSVISCSGTSVGLSYDSISHSLSSSKKFPRISRELLDRTANSTRNGSASQINSSLIGETTPTTPMTAPITTPPTIPITTPTTPGITPSTPTTTTPPPPGVTTPTTPMTPTTPTTTPPTTGSSSGSWCVAKSGVADTSLQVALDYACGIGGADCSPIQQGGACYNPDTVSGHASYAFDSYYKKNGMTPGSCDFGGNAQVTNQDPSSGTCIFPTGGSSVLNTTLPNGGGLGGGSIAPANSSDAAVTSIFFCLPIFFTLISLVLSIIVGGQL
uniref:TSA: Wollemia nobilis Ref_Wollemi_Transcript_6256_1452 transcribed RNA sequence n=1 Tax=Wollemia nobilis TaxID=56998 RepID=A0A0C9QVD6_9CONI